MNLAEVMKELEGMGNPGTKKVLIRHGAREPFFGVKIGDLKKILKKIKKDQQLALELYDTGNSDAMYLAGLAVDPQQLSREQLQAWVDKAYWSLLSESTVAGVAAESPYGRELALEWMDAPGEMKAAAGWATYSGLISLVDNSALDLEELEALLERVEASLQNSPDRVRYAMNSFIINVGVYIPQLREKALAAARAVGKVEVNMGETSCKVPPAPEYIRKTLERNPTARKRKTIRC